MRIAQDTPADAKNHRPVPLDQGFKRELGRLIVPDDELLEKLSIAHPPDCPQAEQPVNLPGRCGSSILHGFSARPGGSFRLFITVLPAREVWLTAVYKIFCRRISILTKEIAMADAYTSRGAD